MVEKHQPDSESPAANIIAVAQQAAEQIEKILGPIEAPEGEEIHIDIQDIQEQFRCNELIKMLSPEEQKTILANEGIPRYVDLDPNTLQSLLSQAILKLGLSVLEKGAPKKKKASLKNTFEALADRQEELPPVSITDLIQLWREDSSRGGEEVTEETETKQQSSIRDSLAADRALGNLYLKLLAFLNSRDGAHTASLEQLEQEFWAQYQPEDE